MTDVERVAQAMEDSAHAPLCFAEYLHLAEIAIATLRRPDSMEVREAHLDKSYGPEWRVQQERDRKAWDVT